MAGCWLFRWSNTCRCLEISCFSSARCFDFYWASENDESTKASRNCRLMQQTKLASFAHFLFIEKFGESSSRRSFIATSARMLVLPSFNLHSEQLRLFLHESWTMLLLAFRSFYWQHAPQRAFVTEIKWKWLASAKSIGSYIRSKRAESSVKLWIKFAVTRSDIRSETCNSLSKL